jgi:tetratricopeptide (TPR) repeat protein
MVMGAAGARVGWVLAGRDNLWAGLEQRERSTDIEYGYKEIVPSDWGLSINFNAGDVGAFTLSDIIAYFDQLCQMVKHCPLPAVLEVGAKRILEITQGVPLAVKIAAGLYVDTADLNMITEEVGGKREIVDQMVRRYLLHARDQQSERATLYALALLRRADHPPTVAVALGLTPVSAKTSYASTLSRLQRRYSFIFTEKDKPSLHQEVRHFLRLWLLEHHDQPEIVAINERLKDAHDTVLKKLEEQRKYSRLEERLKDDQWVEAYLDLAEQHYWLAPVEGLLYLLPFIIAAAIYRRNANNKGAVAVGSFFEKSLQAPYCDWWRWVAQTLRHVANTTASDKEQLMLESLEQLVTGPRCPVFRPPLPEFRPELEAALCWRLGEAYLYQDGNKALAWYEKCINRLGDNVSLKKNVAAALVKVAGDLEKEKKHAERIPLLSRAIELMPDFSLAYVERGCAYDDLQAYQQAMADFDRAIELKPDYSWAYNNRGVVYSRQRKFQQALTNYNHAIELDANYAQPYANRGVVHAILQESQQALTDCNRAIELEPDDATFHQDRGDAHLFLGDRVQALADFNHAYSLDRTYISPLWMIEWANMGKKRAELEVAERLEKIAMINPKDQTAYICQGVAAGLRGQLKAGLAALEQAISIVPGDFGANFWKGMLSAYYYQGRYQIAIEAFEKSIANSLPPILRTPLYWLEDDRPDFFEQYARPLLEKYGI